MPPHTRVPHYNFPILITQNLRRFHLNRKTRLKKGLRIMISSDSHFHINTDKPSRHLQYSKVCESFAISFPAKLCSGASAGETWYSVCLLFLLAELVIHTLREKCRARLRAETGCVSSFRNLRRWVQPKKQCLGTNQVKSIANIALFQSPFCFRNWLQCWSRSSHH